MPSESKKYYMYFILYADCMYMYLDFFKKTLNKSIYFLLVVGAGGIVFVISIAIIMMVKR